MPCGKQYLCHRVSLASKSLVGQTILLTSRVRTIYCHHMVAAASLTYVDETDPVLAAAKRAPLVEWTAEEQALLDDMKGRPVRWIPNDQFMAMLPHDDSR
jgi:hypothetical protein